ncbi:MULTISPECIES: ester cyclase [Dyadobacter]|uniref:Ester cyclase n=1 Tax=Dyadobacter chenwenxiniae TaxID=2906456 RepID=A0A9X1TFW8_9BACT|nr:MULTISPECIES: ester cyclase [Dyadobacter]MCF0051886.1 ester cyclase [Dyadobacter chenwenxiniae]MCF0063417.1 ester cyclase [Dyadobacter chenwenxiniae]
MSLTAEQNNAICVEFFETAWNTGVVREDLLASDAIDHSQVGGKTVSEPGSASFKGIVGMFRGAMPDAKLSIEDQIYVADKVVHRWRLNGTDTGGVMGMPPSGKSITLTGTTTARMKDGKIAERWANVDELGLLQQLGVVPPPPGAAAH